MVLKASGKKAKMTDRRFQGCARLEYPVGRLSASSSLPASSRRMVPPRETHDAHRLGGNAGGGYVTENKIRDKSS